MIKYYCNVCQEEIKEGEPSYVDEDLEFTWGCVSITVKAGIDGNYNSGDLCKDCLIKAMRSFK